MLDEVTEDGVLRKCPEDFELEGVLMPVVDVGLAEYLATVPLLAFPPVAMELPPPCFPNLFDTL